MADNVKGAFFGAAIGDALGVPVEFSSRSQLTANPIQDMRGYGTWNQPPGTFSDDSSLLFCTAESLCNGFNMADIAARFIRWYKEGYWGAHDKLFDIGNATRLAIDRLRAGTDPSLSGGMSESDNGNGSLMRILPILFYLKNEPSPLERYNTVKLVSGITHYHFRSVLSCFIYTELGIQLLTQEDKASAYAAMQQSVNQFISQQSFSVNEIGLFDRILKNDISQFSEESIRSSGYVLDTLESSIWCFLNGSSYRECVLKAVNLGEDTDTTATVTGGLAGIYYGYDAIPEQWISVLAKHEQIVDLAQRFAQRYP
jgi:ADP-ribosylglycohydrolase